MILSFGFTLKISIYGKHYRVFDNSAFGGVKIIDVGRDWPVVLILVGVWGIIREIFKNRKSPPKP
ncbi:MAG: hypothetical protein ABIL50_07675 [candidate division WOR-3 bacterium]